MTGHEFMQLFGALNNLGNQKMPIQTAMQVARLYNQLRKQVKYFEEKRKQMAQEIRVKDGKGGFTPESNQKLQEAINDLFDESIEMRIEGKIKLPATIPSTCEKCHHNMDIVWQVEPNMVAPLIEFLE